MPLYVVGGVGARTAPDLRRPKNELMVAAHSAAGRARRAVEGVRGGRRRRSGGTGHRRAACGAGLCRYMAGAECRMLGYGMT